MALCSDTRSISTPTKPWLLVAKGFAAHIDKPAKSSTRTFLSTPVIMCALSLDSLSCPSLSHSLKTSATHEKNAAMNRPEDTCTCKCKVPAY